MKKKFKNYRHGEVGLFGIATLPAGLKKSETKVLMNGSHGNSHLIDDGEIYLKAVDQYVFGYLVAKNTTLLHEEHGAKDRSKFRKAPIADGVYELRKQQEFINNELKPVID